MATLAPDQGKRGALEDGEVVLQVNFQQLLV
jgi:hypothetical protein